MTLNRNARPTRHSSSWVCISVFLLCAVAGFGFAWAAQSLVVPSHDHDVKIDTSHEDWIDRNASLSNEPLAAGTARLDVRVG